MSLLPTTNSLKFYDKMSKKINTDNTSKLFQRRIKSVRNHRTEEEGIMEELDLNLLDHEG